MNIIQERILLVFFLVLFCSSIVFFIALLFYPIGDWFDNFVFGLGASSAVSLLITLIAWLFMPDEESEEEK